MKSDLNLTEYKARINRVYDYIEKHLDHPFTLEELASVAHFSRFHFNRIFLAMTGETPFRFILRVRLERAAWMLRDDSRAGITEIATRCGFSDLSVFSRNFRQHFGISASMYKRQCEKQSNLSQTDSNKKQDALSSSIYFCFENNQIKWRTHMKLNPTVEVKDFPKMTVAYIRYTGPYQGNETLFEGLWNKLFAWAGPRGLIGGPDFKSMIVYHDDPNITAEEKLRMSVCITVKPDTKVDGEIGKMELDPVKCAVARFVLSGNEFQEAWAWVYGEWLPQSGFQPDDKPCFEMYPEEPRDGKFTVEICVPVKAG